MDYYTLFFLRQESPFAIAIFNSVILTLFHYIQFLYSVIFLSYRLLRFYIVWWILYNCLVTKSPSRLLFDQKAGGEGIRGKEDCISVLFNLYMKSRE